MSLFKEIEFWYSKAIELPKEARVDYLNKHLSHNEKVLQEVKTLILEGNDADGLLTQLRNELSSESFGEEQKPVIDRYHLVSELGRGGMAVVYRAKRTDGEFDHEVAVKVLKRGMDTDDIVRRFRQERNLLARLKHPNIAQIYDGGVTSDGRPYFVMPLIEGMDFVEYMKANSLSRKKSIALFIKVCEAVEFAHQNLIIHRDIKPSNILIDKNEEVKLMDFGVAKLTSVDDYQEFTLPDRNVITPQFASPEQLQNETVDIRSDVYQLGKILEELQSVVDEDSDLKAIKEVCLREKRQHRYASVSELLSDLHNFLSGMPVKARKGNTLYALKKYIGRNKVKAVSAFIILSIIISGTLFFIWQQSVANKEILLEKSIAKSTLNAFLDIFQQAYPSYSKGDTLNVFDLLVIGDTLLSAKANPLIYATYLNLIGEIYDGFNHPKLAKPYYLRSMRVFESADLEFKDSRENLYTVYGNLVDHYLDFNKYDSAYYYLGLYEDFIQKNDSYESVVPDLYSRVAWLEVKRENYDKAIEYYEKAIVAEAKFNDPNLMAIRKAYYGRFLNYYDLSRYRGKIDSLYRDAYSLFVHSGFDSLRKNDFAMVVNFIGIYHMDINELDSAQYYFDKALAINSELFGQNNLATLDNLNNLAVIKLKQMKYLEARKEFRDIWLRANEVGIIPSSSMVYYKNYATTFNKTGDFEVAEIKFDSLVYIREKYARNDLIRLFDARNGLVEATIGLKKYARAKELLLSIIADHEKSMPGDGEQDIRAYIELAKVNKMEGDESAARKIKSENRDRILNRLGSDSEVYALNEEL
ncbi:MAG: serine/threonine-protein kinase [Bacteroidota bacterium]